MRDRTFRLALRDDTVAACRDYEVEPHEVALVAEVDPGHLDAIADFVLTQRIQRREAEFALFLNALFRYTDRSAFYRTYHQQVTVGQFSRLEEARRFLDFAAGFVIGGALPAHLLDILRFCGHIVELAETPMTPVPGEYPAGHPVTATATARLRRPWTVASFHHDMLRLASEEEAYLRQPIPRATTLVLQRDWRTPKRSRAFSVAEHPIIGLLTSGDATVLDMAGRLPQFSADVVFGLVKSLHDRQIVHLIPPAELA
ncbi:hypothetical protein [Actinoplanes sp. CA-252034]|uniref:hypothetical protein n=1 Tax=Actinoplanes sp. CA-252034 TaxID=3239906 RepID=UPI003D99BB90